MEPQPYVSCIKINGVPILPPLMTDDIRTEMNYYKQLAIAVEEKLKALEIAKQTEINRYVQQSTAECEKCEGELEKDHYDSSSNESCTTAMEACSVNSVYNIKTIADSLAKENMHSKSISDSPSESTTDTDPSQSCKSEENDDKLERGEDVFVTSVCSDSVTTSTDLNQYLDGSPPSQSTNATVTPDMVKPRVPKTLDIVPITVEVPRPDEMCTDNESPSPDTPQKLVRQGSYILESPSPMLLAHMQTKLADELSYIPSTTNTATKRKEWNISQAKSEWESQIKNTELVIPNNSKGICSRKRYRRNSISCVNNNKPNRSSPYSASSASFRKEHATRSMDCIRTMVVKELAKENSIGDTSFNVRKETINVNGLNQTIGSNKCKFGEKSSALDLTNKLDGSLGSVDNSDKQSVREKNPKNSPAESVVIAEEIYAPSPRTVVTSMKLLTIFQEIQKKHEEQMAELIVKQQREQNNMQKEFEKQQILLLSQIKKNFPGIPISQPTSVISEVSSVSAPYHSADLSEHVTRRKNYDNLRYGDGDMSAEGKCLLDYIYPLNRDYQEPSSQLTATRSSVVLDERNSKNLISPSLNYRSINRSTDRTVSISDTIDCPEKYSNVSRQLFPLNPHTVHGPVPNKMRYAEKHISAATVINAYARGYLVRRLMKTDRVIALKTTYKEALQCMLKLHVDAPLNLPELNFHRRLQLQCDAASMNIVELFAQSASDRMQMVRQDREIKRSRSERPSSAHSYSFATQRTLARKKLKEMGDYSSPPVSRPCTARTRCQTWASNARDKRSQNIYHGIKRSTSAGTVRKPWR